MNAMIETSGARQAVRPAVGAAATARWPSPPGRSSGSSARTARARPPCCSWPPGCSRRRRARSRSSAASPAAVPRSSRRSASSRRTRRSTRGCRSPSTCGWASGSTRAGTASWRRAGSRQLGLDPRQRAGSLSGGQRAQLALTMAVAKRPELLLLDEPVASLDPLARREFLQTLMEVVAEQGSSVVLSSHLIADLERVCDYLVVLVASRVQLAGEVSELLASHHRLSGPRRDPGSPPVEPGGHRGEPHRPAEHPPCPHRRTRSSTRPGPSGRSPWRTSSSPT